MRDFRRDDNAIVDKERRLHYRPSFSFADIHTIQYCDVAHTKIRIRTQRESIYMSTRNFGQLQTIDIFSLFFSPHNVLFLIFEERLGESKWQRIAKFRLGNGMKGNWYWKDE